MPTPQSTGFTNLSKYVNANQDNQLGTAVQSGVQKGISGLQANVNQANQQFQGDVNQANLNTPQNQQYVQNTIGNISNPIAPAPANSAAPQGQVAPTSQSASPLASLAPPQTMPAPTPATASPSALDITTPAAGSSTASAAPAASTAESTAANAAPGSFGAPAVSNPSTGTTATPNTYTPAAQDVSKFGQLMQGAYTGPTQLNNYNALLSQGQNLQGLGQNLNTQGGLQSLLQQYVGGPGYNQGEQGLDTILLGQTGKPQLQNIAKSLQNVINIPQNAESQAAGLAQQTATGNQQLGQSIQNQITGAENPILQNIQNAINAANTQNQTTQTNAQSIYDLLNNANAVAGPNGNRIGGGYAAPTTDLEAAQKAASQANQLGLTDADTYAQLNKLIPMMQAAGKDPKTLLAQAFNNAPIALPQYSLQQGANAQQAAQLNALQQLSGQAPQYTNYGGITPVSAGFDLSKLPTIASLTPAPAPVYGPKPGFGNF